MNITTDAAGFRLGDDTHVAWSDIGSLVERTNRQRLDVLARDGRVLAQIPYRAEGAEIAIAQIQERAPCAVSQRVFGVRRPFGALALEAVITTAGIGCGAWFWYHDNSYLFGPFLIAVMLWNAYYEWTTALRQTEIRDSEILLRTASRERMIRRDSIQSIAFALTLTGRARRLNVLLVLRDEKSALAVPRGQSALDVYTALTSIAVAASASTGFEK